MNIQTLKALSEPNRLHIVELLIKGPKSVGDIVIRLNLSQPLVSKHLKTLTSANLVEVTQEKQKRIYTLKPKPFKEIDSWLSSYRKMWNERLDRLDMVIENEKRTNDNQDI